MRATDFFDDYLQGRLSAEEVRGFEQSLAADAALAAAFNDHKAFVEAMGQQADREALKKKLNAIHEKEFGFHTRIISLQDNFAKRHGKTIAVAASTAFIAVMGTVAVLSTGGYLLRQQSNEITELQRNVMELRSSSEGIVEGITKSKKTVYAPATLEGSAFALNNAGYIVTSYHMVKDADSIFVRNGTLEHAYATLVLNDPKLDLAVLKIDSALAADWQVPFTFKEKQPDVGEKVFTLGYPRREMVYGEGSLSSLSGYGNDTSMYQVSIPVNPGNSGGPLLDENGNVIGVIRGKITGAEATGFAIKASEILASIATMKEGTGEPQIVAANPKKLVLKNQKRSEQVKKINPYVFNVLVYKKE